MGCKATPQSGRERQIQPPARLKQAVRTCCSRGTEAFDDLSTQRSSGYKRPQDDRSGPIELPWFRGSYPRHSGQNILPDIYELPEGFLPTLTHTHREVDVMQYSRQGPHGRDTLFWRIIFFERLTFLGVVLEEPFQQDLPLL